MDDVCMSKLTVSKSGQYINDNGGTIIANLKLT